MCVYALTCAIARGMQDVSTIDTDLMSSFASAGNTFSQILWTVVTISVVTPLFVLLVAPLAVVYVYVQVCLCVQSRPCCAEHVRRGTTSGALVN